MLTSVDLRQGEGPWLQAWLMGVSWVGWLGANADTAGRDSRWRQVMEVERGGKKGLNVSWRAGHWSSAWEVEAWAGHPSEARSRRRACTDEAALLCSGKSVTRDAQQNGDGARDTTWGPPGRTSDIEACLGFMYCDREPVTSLCLVRRLRMLNQQEEDRSERGPTREIWEWVKRWLNRGTDEEQSWYVVAGQAGLEESVWQGWFVPSYVGCTLFPF